tara:strand:- start:8344 stop:9024 length:681 start_codon:yes stop_codon:yes gene_type:complete
MLKSDFHLHTSEDPCDRIKYNAQTLIKQCAKLNFNVLAITNHESIFYNNSIKSYAKKHGILLIPGMEARIKFKDVLLLNPPLGMKNPKTFNELYKVKEKNPEMLVIAPHPYFIDTNCLGRKLKQHIKLFDVIEHCYFYHNIINRNKKAIRIATKYNKPMIANSDSHRLYQLNTNFTLVDANQDKDSVLEAIRKSNLVIKTRPLTNHEFGRIFTIATKNKFRKKLFF